MATLVASGAPPRRVFEQVTEEVARLLGMPGASVMRYDGARTATVVGGWSDDGDAQPPARQHLRPRRRHGGRQGPAQRRPAAGGPLRGCRRELAATLQRSGYSAAVAAPVAVGGELWGALAAGTRSDEPLRAGVEKRLCDFADLVAQALANADAHEQLAASRARIVEAGDAERRRLERNLHDGAQQRLVSLALDLRMIDATLEKDPPTARTILEGAQEQLAQGLDELRELARGIHPAVLTDRGLGPALEALVDRAPLPVELTELPDERLSGPVEAAAYYVVAEAVTNVAKYARASHVTVSVRRSNGNATVEVADDGIGGADAEPRHRVARPGGPARGARRPPRGGQPGRARHPHQRRDPVSGVTVTSRPAAAR